MRAFTKSLIPAVCASALSLIATAASADTYDLTLVGGSYTAHWQMDSSPMVQPDHAVEGILWAVEGVQGDFNGLSTQYISFINGGLLGGLMIGNDIAAGDYNAYAWGLQVYSGSELTPTLLLGTYALVGADFSTAYVLTISQAAPVPEPESYALMLGGLSALGFVAARRRKA